MSTFTIDPTTNAMSGFTMSGGISPKLVISFVLLIKNVLWIESKTSKPQVYCSALSYQPCETVIRVTHYLFCKIELVDQNRQGRLTLVKTTLLLGQVSFPKWSRTFIEFSEFRESDKSLKHELGSI